MEKFTLGNVTLVKMEAQQYATTYGQQYGDNVVAVVWAEQYNTDGDIVASSTENMLVYANGQYAYTSRGIVCIDTLSNCLAVALALEQF